MADSVISPSGGPLVLIVDDHADSREMCATLLELSGFRTAEAGDGIEAVAMAKVLTPDCILMDLSLPGIDGREATRQLKADERTRDLPVIAVSGQPIEGGTSSTGMESFSAIVTKPCAPEAVLSAIRLALGRA
jgi:CheY-like chemotaxis protein